MYGCLALLARGCGRKRDDKQGRGRKKLPEKGISGGEVASGAYERPHGNWGETASVVEGDLERVGESKQPRDKVRSGALLRL